MQVEKVAIESLSFDPSNARKHDSKNIEAIKGSLRKFGQRHPIVVRNNVVLAGNGRLQAARELGWSEIEVVRADDMSATEAVAFSLSDNRSAEMATWDDDILGKQLHALFEDGFEIGDIGFDPGEFDFEKESGFGGGKTDEDDVPEVEENIFGVKRGDIWQLGEHRLMCGDSTSKEDVDRLMAATRANFCFTSPPYSDQRDYNGQLELDPKHLAKFLSAPCDLFAVNLGLKRKDKEVEQYWDEYIKAAKEYGHKFLSWNIWSREDSGYTVGQISAMFAIDHEWIFVFGKYKNLNLTVKNKDAGQFNDHSTQRQKSGKTTKPKAVTIRDKRQLGTILKCNTQLARNLGFDHPAMFPVELAESYIEACSNSCDIVYEPFCGSGSTLIACEKTGRKCYGMEIDPHYCSVIIKRWQDYTGKVAEKLTAPAI